MSTPDRILYTTHAMINGTRKLMQNNALKQDGHNLAFIDGQNLYMGVISGKYPWQIDLFRFRGYLAKKYQVKTAYYFLGYLNSDYKNLYRYIQKAGFALVFKQHNHTMQGEKKGNVDTDIVFTIMKKLYKREDFESIVLVSGDGDYKMLVDFLIEERRLEKILFPNTKFASSLYKKLPNMYYDSLEYDGVRKKIEKQKRVPLGS